MVIYVSHSKDFDYKIELYLPLRNSFLNSKHQIILPFELSDEPYNSKDLFEDKRCDMVVAEVSSSSTVQGVELGWASLCGIQIICISKAGSHVTDSLKVVCKEFLEYDNPQDLKLKLEEYLKDFD